MNIAEILNNDNGQERTSDETSKNTSLGSPGKRPRDSPDIDRPLSPGGGIDPLDASVLPALPLPSSRSPPRAMSTPSTYSTSGSDSIITHRKSKSISLGSSRPEKEEEPKVKTEGQITNITGGSGSELEGSDKKGKSKRSKAKNSTWTIEDDRRLVDLVMSTLPTQDFAEYARILNKRDAQTVRYRWKVILRRAKSEGL